MYCTHCGKETKETDRFCSECGGARQPRPFFSERSDDIRLTRPREGKKIAGVCAGVARYFDLDVTLVRFVWIMVTVFPPIPGLIAYIACWIVMPKDPLPLQATATRTASHAAGV